MVTTHAGALENRTATDSLDVRFRGKLLPDRPRTTSSERFHELECEPTEVPLKKRLSDALWIRLPFAAHAANAAKDGTAIVRSYIDSLNQLQTFRKDLVHLVSVTCETNLEFRQGKGAANQKVRDESLRETLKQMIARVELPTKPIQNDLTASVAALPVEELLRILRSALKTAVAEIASAVEHALEQMAQQKLAGLVEWVGQSACRYHFFREVVIQDNDGFKSTTEITTRSRGKGRRQQVVAKTTSGVSGRTIHRWARHEHHVMNAFHTSLKNTRVVMPPEAQRIYGALPDWLRPFVRVIQGDLIRERVIECDYHSETWSNMTTREIDLPMYGPDPAITIGNFVLIGWGPKDSEAEQKRQDALQVAARPQQLEADARHRQYVWFIAAIASALATALFADFSGNYSSVGSCLGIALSLYAVINAARAHLQAYGCSTKSDRDLMYVIAIAMLGLALAVGVQFRPALHGIAGDSVVPLLFGALCFLHILCREPFHGRFFASRAKPE